ncbi:Metacaspase-1 [Cladobotryum mycophilum]|uniref:Metacaspase-1 n=1 Tax=Cladobotryum mycophilum TaxID=491253 RepID=A0ABR0SV07_9HYPO
MSTHQPSVPPKARALLIGSPVKPLIAPPNDVHAMEQVLSLYNFSVTKCLRLGDGSYPATREGIRHAWHQLIWQTRPSDAVLIYYSGHGGLTEVDAREHGHLNRRLQYLIPLDFAETKEADWRGLSDIEIADLLQMTTKKTKNVTTILDCCHSAHMARGPTVAKTIDPTDYSQVNSHIKRMIHRAPFPSPFHHERNPDVLSIVAAPTSESAYEKIFPNGERMGVLTEALTNTLRISVGSDLSWRDLMHRIRDRMSRTCPEQYPDIEGPQDRLPFKEDLAVTVPGLSIVDTPTGPVLKGGLLHGVAQGDVYSIMPFGGQKLNEKDMIAEAEVVQVGTTESKLLVSWKTRRMQLSHGTRGFIWKKALGQFPIAYSGSDQFVAELEKYLLQSPFLRPAGKDEAIEGLVRVEERDTGIKIWHHRHYLVRDWEMAADQNLKLAVAKTGTVLKSLAQAQHLLSLQDDPFPGPLRNNVRCEMGYVEPSQRHPYPESDATLVKGTNMYVSVTNTGPRTLYIFVFDVCGDSVTLLSNASPSGVELEQGKEYCFGKVDLTDELPGSPIGWPPEIPKAESLPETIVIMVTTGKIDLRNLETGPVYAGEDRQRGQKIPTLKQGEPLSPCQSSTVFDPNGDLVFAFQARLEPFAPFDEKLCVQPRIQLEPEENPPKRQRLSSGSSTSQTEQQNSPIENLGKIQQSSLRFKASSKHLSLACPRFKQSLRYDLGSILLMKLPTNESWNPDALQTVMNVIHGSSRKVPEEIELAPLAEIAEIVDYYQCYEVIDPYWKMWKANLNLPSELDIEYGRDIILYLFISLVFRNEKLFRETVNRILYVSRGPIQTLGLAIPLVLVDKIEQLRVSAVQKSLDTVDEYVEDICDRIEQFSEDALQFCEDILRVLRSISELSGEVMATPSRPANGSTERCKSCKSSIPKMAMVDLNQFAGYVTVNIEQAAMLHHTEFVDLATITQVDEQGHRKWR